MNMTIFSYKNIYIIFSFVSLRRRHISGLNKIYCIEGSSQPPKTTEKKSF